jgi:hypothetical protein
VFWSYVFGCPKKTPFVSYRTKCCSDEQMCLGRMTRTLATFKCVSGVLYLRTFLVVQWLIVCLLVCLFLLKKSLWVSSRSQFFFSTEKCLMETLRTARLSLLVSGSLLFRAFYCCPMVDCLLFGLRLLFLKFLRTDTTINPFWEELIMDECSSYLVVYTCK